jgi:hypothetical protein
MNELVEDYLRRIHQAGGVPTEQTIDTTDASPRSRALAPSIAPRPAVSARPFHNAAVDAGRNVNHSVCLMP